MVIGCRIVGETFGQNGAGSGDPRTTGIEFMGAVGWMVSLRMWVMERILRMIDGDWCDHGQRRRNEKVFSAKRSQLFQEPAHLEHVIHERLMSTLGVFLHWLRFAKRSHFGGQTKPIDHASGYREMGSLERACQSPMRKTLYCSAFSAYRTIVVPCQRQEIKSL